MYADVFTHDNYHTLVLRKQYIFTEMRVKWKIQVAVRTHQRPIYAFSVIYYSPFLSFLEKKIIRIKENGNYATINSFNGLSSKYNF